MDIKECYEMIGGDYDEVMSRLRTDERVKKFLLKVAEDKSYSALCENLAAHNIEEAFRAAHTLKGVGLNLSLTRLHKSASAMTEALRGKTEYSDEYLPYLEQVKKDYELTINGIKALD